MSTQLGFGEVEFQAEVERRWGEICPDLLGEGMHYQMDALGRLCKNSLSTGGEILFFLEALLVRKDTISEIENAIAISFMLRSEFDRFGYKSSAVPNVYRVLKEREERGRA